MITNTCWPLSHLTQAYDICISSASAVSAGADELTIGKGCLVLLPCTHPRYETTALRPCDQRIVKLG